MSIDPSTTKERDETVQPDTKQKAYPVRIRRCADVQGFPTRRSAGVGYPSRPRGVTEKKRKRQLRSIIFRRNHRFHGVYVAWVRKPLKNLELEVGRGQIGFEEQSS